MRRLPLTVLYYGSAEPLPERHSLAAGPLSAVFEEGQLVDIRWRGREVLRRIYAAVRDRDWGTVPLRLSALHIEQQADSFQVAFNACHRRDDIEFAWKGAIRGDSNGELTFSMHGEALSSFLRSRIGFCLLHSARDCAGKSFEVRRPDLTAAGGRFPEAISREQPIAGAEAIHTLAWEPAPGLRVSVQFEGDVFQIEDQRNWTDATFKTFSTPLEFPCPVRISKGAKVSQTVRISLEEAQPPSAAIPSSDVIVLTLGGETVAPVPPIGLGLASHGEPLTAREVRLLRELRLSHLRVDLRLWEPGWRSELRRAATEASQLHCKLEAAVFVSNSAELELEALRAAVEREHAKICRWLIFHQSESATSERWVLLAGERLRSQDSPARFGSGTNAGFCEVARFRGPAVGQDFVCFSVQPQEHASDNASLMETLPIQGEVVENARRLHGGLPVVISPVTLKARFNPYATSPGGPSATGELPREVDVRQMSLFGAAWTLGSLKYLSEARVSSVTYYETTGWRGVMERETGSPLPERFSSIAGAVFPLYHVLACVGRFAGGEILSVDSSAPSKVCAVAARKDGSRCLLVANLTPETLRVVVRGLPEEADVTGMDENSPGGFRAMEPREGNPLTIELRPYAVMSMCSRA